MEENVRLGNTSGSRAVTWRTWGELTIIPQRPQLPVRALDSALVLQQACCSTKLAPRPHGGTRYLDPTLVVGCYPRSRTLPKLSEVTLDAETLPFLPLPPSLATRKSRTLRNALAAALVGSTRPKTFSQPPPGIQHVAETS
jgi:hypothetical protein